MAQNYTQESGSPSTRGLILVSLDFHDGSKCKVWLQPEVVCRLQQGDDSLMEDLHRQFASSSTTQTGGEGLKRKVGFTINEDTKKPRTFVNFATKKEDIQEFGTPLTDGQSLESATTYYIDDSVKPLTPETASAVVNMVSSNTRATENFGGQLVDALGNVDQYSYLEELTVGEENYIELPSGTTYTIRDGMLINESEHHGKVIVKQEQSYSPNIQRKKRKKGLRRYMKYSVEERDEAVKLIKAGQLSQQEASRKFNIPQGTLSDHVRSGGTQWKCSICSRKFSLRMTLEQHHLTHYETRPYLCDLCGFNTRDRTTLLKHRMKKHSDNPEDFEVEIIGVPAQTTKQTAWTPESTRAFLEEYESCLNKFDNETMKKKYIWQMIADRLCEKGFIVNCRQAHNKWKTMINSYRTYLTNKEDRRVFAYADEMEAFMQRNEGKGIDMDETSTRPQEKVTWNNESIGFLIQEYEARMDRFDSNLIKKKVLWKEIYEVFKEKGYRYSFGQVQNKWKVLVRNYKTFKSNSAVAEGEGIRYFPYYEHLSRLVDNRPDQVEEKFDFIQEESSDVQETEIITQPFDVTAQPFPQEEGVVANTEIQYLVAQEEQTIEDGQIIENTEVLNDESSLAALESITTIKHDSTEESEMVTEESEVKGKVEWNDTSVQLLLSEYEALLSKFRNPIVKKKLLWQKIFQNFTENGYTMSAQQIENKWRVLTRNYVKASSENVVANNDTYPYFEEMKRIMETKIEETGTENIDQDESELYSIDELAKVWTQTATMLLLLEYEHRIERFEDNGVKKKVLWQEISEALCAKGVVATAAQAENKWKVLLRCYKIATGAIPVAEGKKIKDFPYIEKMNEILKNRIEFTAEGQSIQIDGGISQDHCQWSHDATSLLLREYGVRLNKFDSEYIKRKEYLWQEIALVFKDHGYTYTVAQLMNKWKSSLKKYRTVVEIIYSDSIPVHKKRKKIDSFPYLIEMGQLLGHNHDLVSILQSSDEHIENAEFGWEDQGDKGKGKKNKGKFNISQPSSYAEVVKYFNDYEAKREELDQIRVKQLKDIEEEKLLELETTDNLLEHFKLFEVKREALEKERMKDMANMHREKMIMLKRLLKAVRKKKKE